MRRFLGRFFSSAPGWLALILVLGGISSAAVPVFNGLVTVPGGDALNIPGSSTTVQAIQCTGHGWKNGSTQTSCQDTNGNLGLAGSVRVAAGICSLANENVGVWAGIAGGGFNDCHNNLISMNPDWFTGGPDDIAIGPDALASSSGDSNANGSTIAIGGGALERNAGGYYNVAIGRHALTQDTTGYDNVCVGLSCIGAATDGHDNAALGFNALLGGDPTHSVAIGSGAMQLATATPSDNAAIGYNSGENLSGVDNAFLGSSTGVSTTSGSYNIFVGFQAGQSTTTAQWNVFIGTSAGKGATTGTQNVLIGGAPNSTDNAQVTTGNKNVAIGYAAMVPSATTDGQLSIQNAIYGSGNTAADTTTSSGCIAFYSQSCTAGTVKSAVPIQSPNAGQITCSLSATTTCTAFKNVGAGFTQCTASYDYTSVGSQAQLQPLMVRYVSPNVNAYVSSSASLTGTAVVDYVCF